MELRPPLAFPSPPQIINRDAENNDYQTRPGVKGLVNQKYEHNKEDSQTINHR